MASDSPKDVVFLDISGTVFKTQVSTLLTIPHSRLASLEYGTNMRDKKPEEFYFNRDSDSFKHILNAYRCGELHMSRNICPQQFLKELIFWNIPIQLLAPCCWKTFYATHDDLTIISALLQRLRAPLANSNKIHTEIHTQMISTLVGQERTNAQDRQVKQESKEKRSNKLWQFLEEPTSSTAAKVSLKCLIYSLIIED